MKISFYGYCASPRAGTDAVILLFGLSKLEARIEN